MKHTVYFVFMVAGIMVSAGCHDLAPTADDADLRKQLALLMPSRIEIVEPFTRISSFEGSSAPDGIELMIQAFNALENPGLMIAGTIRIGLYEHIAASGDAKGRRLERWNVELATTQQQRAHWNAMTQMYEFRLGIEAGKIPPADKYILAVTYSSPFGERLTDECLIRHQRATGGTRVRRNNSQ